MQAATSRYTALNLDLPMAEPPTDRAAIRSFDRLYEDTFQDVLAYCRRRTQNPEDADEAAAETYLIA